jgi:hypothetical protein
LYQGVSGGFADGIAVIMLQNEEEGLGGGFLGEGSEGANHRLAKIIRSVGSRLNPEVLQDLLIVGVLSESGRGSGCGDRIPAS